MWGVEPSDDVRGREPDGRAFAATVDGRLEEKTPRPRRRALRGMARARALPRDGSPRVGAVRHPMRPLETRADYARRRSARAARERRHARVSIRPP